MKLVTAQQYYDSLLNEVATAKRRILLQAMSWDASSEIITLIDAALEAKSRGVNVVLVCDVISLSFLGKNPRRIRQLLNRAKHGGIMVRMVGEMGLNPVAGHNHIKAAVIDDVAYVGGGTNLTAKSIHANDVMTQFASSEFAEYLWNMLPFAGASTDAEYRFDTRSTLLLDAGIKNESIILTTANEMVERAQEVWYMSKLAPNGALVRSLSGTRAHVYFNKPRRAGLLDSIAILLDTDETPADNLYKSSKYLHAKILVTKNSDGMYEALSGSHNFNTRGVRFGTAEAALYSSDQSYCRQLLSFVRDASMKKI